MRVRWVGGGSTHGHDWKKSTAAGRRVREAVSYLGLFTAGWFDVREKYCFWLEIYDRLRASEQAGEPRLVPLQSPSIGN